MTLEETLLAELKALRGGTGLSDARLREQPALVQHLPGASLKDKANALVELVGELRGQEEQTAVRYAFGVEGAEGNRLAKQRRKAASEVLSISERTLIRRELYGLAELARAIIERSPALTNQQREEAVNATATEEDRITHLEKALVILARRMYASEESNENIKDWLNANEGEENEELYILAHTLDLKYGGIGLLMPPESGDLPDHDGATRSPESGDLPEID
jgi:hypothetical protein